MAATPDVSAIADANLQELHDTLDDLPRVVHTWGYRSEDSRVTFYLEWDELMRRLDGLTRARQQRRLSPEQERSYCSLVDKLRAANGVLARLDLEHPRLALTPPSAIA